MLSLNHRLWTLLTILTLADAILYDVLGHFCFTTVKYFVNEFHTFFSTLGLIIRIMVVSNPHFCPQSVLNLWEKIRHIPRPLLPNSIQPICLCCWFCSICLLLCLNIQQTYTRQLLQSLLLAFMHTESSVPLIYLQATSCSQGISLIGILGPYHTILVFHRFHSNLFVSHTYRNSFVTRSLFLYVWFLMCVCLIISN